MTLVKVCGLRSLDEAAVALDAGANMLGFIFWRPGKRYVAPMDAAAIVRALRPRADFAAVGVFVDPMPDEVDEAIGVCDLDYVQLSGNESAELVQAMPRPTVKAIHVRAGEEALAAEMVAANAFGARHYLLDTHGALPGGTGVTFDWQALRAVGGHCLVAGGLKPDNVGTALATLAPLGVDVSSGVEYPGGGKDPTLIRAFLEAVRAHDSHHL
jgi:phosphoribosylanthranilate isomerase